MKFIKLLIATLAVSLASAAKECGPGIGSCSSSKCCSKYGYCGTSDAHCGTGCQSGFGKCGIVSTKKTTTTRRTTTTIKKTTTISSKKTSTNDKCGGSNGVCPGSKCCSKYGYCGNTEAHCGTGCQSEFGKCGSSYISSSSSNSSTSTSTSYNGFQMFYQCKNSKHWALTYDDGPYKFDNDLLDLLDKYQVKATFFVNGNNNGMDIYSDYSAKLIKRMHQSGHIIGNHTWRHTDLAEASNDKIRDEMKKVEDAIYKHIGKRPAFMRLPYGSGHKEDRVKKVLGELGYTAGFQWNVDTNDWKYTGDVDYALARFKEKIGKPILSLNHVYYSGITKEKLLTLTEKEIIYMHKQGYKFVTAAECVGLPAYK